MKRMFLNKAIISYANFIKRVANLKDNENDTVTKDQYKKFLNNTETTRKMVLSWMMPQVFFFVQTFQECN